MSIRLSNHMSTFLLMASPQTHTAGAQTSLAGPCTSLPEPQTPPADLQTPPAGLHTLFGQQTRRGQCSIEQGKYLRMSVHASIHSYICQ